jgi:hypothetical protein
MALPAAVADINAFTNRLVINEMPNVVYKDDPLFVRMLSKKKVFPGGTSIIEPISYNKLIGGAFLKTGTFTTTYVQTEVAFSVVPKFYYVNVNLYGTDSVLNRGREAYFSVAETKMANAAQRMAELLANDIYRDGLTSSGDVTTSGGALSTTTSLDGLLSWIDDGNTVGTTTYTAATTLLKSFTTVGGLTRDDLWSAAPTFTDGKTPISAVGGANAYTNRTFNTFSLPEINKAYSASWFGRESVDLIVAPQGGYNKMWEAMVPSQRFMDNDSDVAKVGFTSFRFNGAQVVISKYIHDTVMLGLNTNGIKMYVSDNKLFQFGFTGFKEAADSVNYNGQFLFGGNITVPSPRNNFKLVGTGLS